MKILIYANKAKDKSNEWLNSLKTILTNQEIDFELLLDENLCDTKIADAVIVLGGDGTILALTEFVSKNNIPVIGINAGKVGFLTEFEKNETEKAVKLLKNGELFLDERNVLEIKSENDIFYALNDVFVQRIFNSSESGIVLDYELKVNDTFKIRARGDGLILSTPTGSTAYSLSCGGAILAPDSNVFSVMPISSRPLYLRPFVYPTDKKCEITVMNDISAGLFIDGKQIKSLKKGQKIECIKAQNKVTFLRDKKSDSYGKLVDKLYGDDGKGK